MIMSWSMLFITTQVVQDLGICIMIGTLTIKGALVVKNPCKSYSVEFTVP